MAIDVLKLAEYMSKSLGASGAMFEEMILSSVNDVSRDLASRTVLSISTSGSDGETVDALSDTISLDNKYLSVYKDGVEFYMARKGEWGREPDEKIGQYYQQSIANAQRLALDDEDGDVGFNR